MSRRISQFNNWLIAQEQTIFYNICACAEPGYPGSAHEQTRLYNICAGADKIIQYLRMSRQDYIISAPAHNQVILDLHMSRQDDSIFAHEQTGYSGSVHVRPMIQSAFIPQQQNIKSCLCLANYMTCGIDFISLGCTVLLEKKIRVHTVHDSSFANGQKKLAELEESLPVGSTVAYPLPIAHSYRRAAYPF